MNDKVKQGECLVYIRDINDNYLSFIVIQQSANVITRNKRNDLIFCIDNLDVFDVLAP